MGARLRLLEDLWDALSDGVWSDSARSASAERSWEKVDDEDATPSETGSLWVARTAIAISGGVALLSVPIVAALVLIVLIDHSLPEGVVWTGFALALLSAIPIRKARFWLKARAIEAALDRVRSRERPLLDATNTTSASSVAVPTAVDHSLHTRS